MATTEVFIVTSNNKSYKVIGDLVNELNRLGNDATVEVEGTITGVGTNSPQIIVDHYAIIDLNGNGRPLVGYLTTKDANWVAGSDIPTELVSADFYLSTEKEELPIRTTNQTTLLHLKNIAVQSGIGPKLFIYGLEDGYIKPYRWGVIREITN